MSVCLPTEGWERRFTGDCVVSFTADEREGEVEGGGDEELGEGVRTGHEEDEKKEEVYGEVGGVDEVGDKWGTRGWGDEWVCTG